MQNASADTTLHRHRDALANERRPMRLMHASLPRFDDLSCWVDRSRPCLLHMVNVSIATGKKSTRQHLRWCRCIQWCMSRGSLETAKVLPRPRLDVLMPRLGHASVSILRYDIIIHNFHPFIFCIYVFKTFKTKLHLCFSSVFRSKLNVFGVCVASWI